MKKITIAVIIFGLFGAIFFTRQNKNEIYPTTTTVCDINYEMDTVMVRTSTNFVYEFKGVEDWEIGDICACIMNDNGTKDITDDKIIKTRYCGSIQE